MNNQNQSASPVGGQQKPATEQIQQQQIKKPKPKKWLIPVIVIVGVIVLGLLVWAGYSIFKSASPEEPIIEDEFKNWKTYRNELYGFKFKHPSSWGFEYYGPFKVKGDLLHTISFVDPTIDPLVNPNRKNFWNVDVFDISTTNLESCGFMSKEEDLLEKNDIYIGGRKAKEIICQRRGEMTGIISRHYILKTDNFIYSMTSDFCHNDKEEICNEIILTFKLMNPAVDFIEYGNILARDSEWYLLYEKPGAPALRLDLIINENTLCRKSGRASQPDKLCSEYKWESGEHVGIEGKKENDKVIVKRLTLYDQVY